MEIMKSKYVPGDVDGGVHYIAMLWNEQKTALESMTQSELDTIEGVIDKIYKRLGAAK